MPDPGPITTAIWQDIGEQLIWLILFVIFIIGFGMNLLLAHAILPSLFITGELPAKISEKVPQLRRALYMAALGSLIVAIVFLGLTIAATAVIGDFYERWWF